MTAMVCRSIANDDLVIIDSCRSAIMVFYSGEKYHIAIGMSQPRTIETILLDSTHNISCIIYC